MMKKAILIGAGISLLGYAFFRYFKHQAALLLNYSYKFVGISFKKFTKNEIAFDMTIRFTSKADIEARIKKVYLDLFLEGKNVGYLQEEKSFILPARGSHDITLFVSFNPQVVIKNLADIVLGVARNKDIMFGVDGFADIQSGFIQTTLPIKYQTSLKEYLKGIPTLG